MKQDMEFQLTSATPFLYTPEVGDELHTEAGRFTVTRIVSEHELLMRPYHWTDARWWRWFKTYALITVAALGTMALWYLTRRMGS